MENKDNIITKCRHWLANAISKTYNLFYVRCTFFKYRAYTIIWLYPHIGDLFYGLPCAEEYKRVTNHKTLLIGNVKYEKMYRRFGGIDKYHLVKEKSVWRFLGAHNCSCVRKYLRKMVKLGRYIPNDIDLISSEHPIDRSRPLQEYTQLYVYGLPNDFHPNYPLTNEGKKLSDNKYVIIAPYAQTVKKVDLNLFEPLVNSLNGLGYEVYTNAHGSEKEIKGTKRLDCSLDDLEHYAVNADGVVTLRSGVSDLLGALTKTTLFVLFNGYALGKNASVAAYRKNSDNVYEYYEDVNKEIIDDIVKHFNNRSVKD